MAPQMVEAGDLYIFFEGGGTLILLRPCEPPQEESHYSLMGRHGTLDPQNRPRDQLYYEYVGHCYVHNMMDGGDLFSRREILRLSCCDKWLVSSISDGRRGMPN